MDMMNFNFSENETDLANGLLQNFTKDFDVQCDNRTVSMLQAVLMGVISSSGFLFNVMVILIVIALREYKKTSHWYVLNLAFADAIFLVMLPLKIVENLSGRWSFGLTMCYAYNTVFYANYYAGIFFLTVMSFDRYVAIVHPVSARWRRFRSKEYSWFITGFVWALAVAASLPLVFKTSATCICGFDFKTSDVDSSCPGTDITDQRECEIFLRAMKELESDFPSSGEGSNEKKLEELYELDVDNTSLDDALQRTDEMGDFCFHPKYRYFEVWIYCNFFVAFVAPVVIMSVCYSCILWRVLHPRIPSSRNSRLPFKIYGRKKKDSSKIKQAHVNGSFTNANQRNNNRITVLVVSLVVIFIVCWLPFHVMHIAKVFRFRMNASTCKHLHSVTFLMAYLNSLLNPIFYTFLGTHFRRRLRNVWNRVKFQCGSKKDAFTTFKYTKSKERGQNHRYPGTQTTKVNDSSYCHSGDPSNIQLRLLKSTKESEANAI